jgi:hypothetical protein
MLVEGQLKDNLIIVLAKRWELGYHATIDSLAAEVWGRHYG